MLVSLLKVLAVPLLVHLLVTVQRLWRCFDTELYALKNTSIFWGFDWQSPHYRQYN